MEPAPRPALPSGCRLCHARKSLLDGRRPEGWCQQQSSAPPFITQLKDLVPGCSGEVRLETIAFECSLSELEVTPTLPFRHNLAQALFYDDLHGCALLVGKCSNLFKKAIRYLYGCLHMANHIIAYGKSSRSFEKTWEECRGPVNSNQ
jgi:hypothetical protein